MIEFFSTYTLNFFVIFQGASMAKTKITSVLATILIAIFILDSLSHVSASNSPGINKIKPDQDLQMK